MKDEIKEILDWLKDYKIDRPFGMSIYDRKILSDYITNLQEENENLKDYLKIMEKGKDNNLNRFLDYKSRNEKAIKCIKDKYYKEEYERKGTFTNKLMSILQGEYNNE